MEVTSTGKVAIKHDHEVNRWSIQSKLTIGAGVIALLALAAIATSNAMTHYQNGNIDSVNCGRGYQYYQDVVYKNKATASEIYCYAEMREKGNGAEQSLSEARKWYKEAFDQGLRTARSRLCQPHMFEYKFKDREDYIQLHDIIKEYTQYRDICCPTPPPGTVCAIPSCPWQKEYNPNFSC